MDLGGVWNKGAPIRSLYQYKVVIALCEQTGFHFAQDFYWYNPGALPAPAEWVNVRRIRVKCAVNQVFWLSKTEWPKADNKRVLKPYSRDMLRLIDRGYRPKQRPSGHNITSKFRKNHGGAIPPNLLEFGNNDSNSSYLKVHRADDLMRRQLFDRVHALRLRGFNSVFRGAEINMHLSLSREMIAFEEFLRILATRGERELTVRLDRGEI